MAKPEENLSSEKMQMMRALIRIFKMKSKIDADGTYNVRLESIKELYLFIILKTFTLKLINLHIYCKNIILIMY